MAKQFLKVREGNDNINLDVASCVDDRLVAMNVEILVYKENIFNRGGNKAYCVDVDNSRKPWGESC